MKANGSAQCPSAIGEKRHGNHSPCQRPVLPARLFFQDRFEDGKGKQPRGKLLAAAQAAVSPMALSAQLAGATSHGGELEDTARSRSRRSSGMDSRITEKPPGSQGPRSGGYSRAVRGGVNEATGGVYGSKYTRPILPLTSSGIIKECIAPPNVESNSECLSKRQKNARMELLSSI